MATYKELLQARQQLEQQIEQARAAAVGEAVAKARALVEEFGLTPDDVFGRRSKNAGKPVAAKYRDPQTGATWTGRGKPPRWIADKNPDDFLIG